VLLSLLAAMWASAIALFVASRTTMGLARAAIGSVFMGGAIAGMHYIGMAAMRVPAMCHYSWWIAGASVLPVVAGGFVLGSLTRSDVEQACQTFPAHGR